MNMLGRIRVIDEIARKMGGFSLSVGSKSTRLADVNCDINRNVRPDIVATVFHLPFRSATFDTILFTDVVEFLPADTETIALLELKRCLNETGRLLLSAANEVGIYTFLDPERWILRHQHYGLGKLSTIVNAADLHIEWSIAMGGIWYAISLLIYYFIRYPFSKMLKRDIPGPLKLDQLADAQYHNASSRGYTIFVVCTQ